MDVGIDSSSFKNDAKSDKSSDTSDGSSGKMNGGDPLTDSVGAGIASDIGFWTLIVGAVGSAFGAVFAWLRVTNEARLAEMKTQFDARLTDVQTVAKGLQETCDKQQKAIDECTHDREELRISYAVLSKEMQFIKSKITDRP